MNLDRRFSSASAAALSQAIRVDSGGDAATTHVRTRPKHLIGIGVHLEIGRFSAMESIRRLLASLMSLSRGRLINPVAAKISCALIALAVLQRANEVRLAVSVGKEVPTAWLAFVVSTLALGTLLHVWR